LVTKPNNTDIQTDQWTLLQKAIVVWVEKSFLVSAPENDMISTIQKMSGL
jgi:hypothetical protein